jgi:hypothetical protein
LVGGADAAAQAEGARAALNHAQAILAKMPELGAGRPYGPNPPFDVGNFSDWLHAQILVQEAERLLGKGELHRSKSK